MIFPDAFAGPAISHFARALIVAVSSQLDSTILQTRRKYLPHFTFPTPLLRNYERRMCSRSCFRLMKRQDFSLKEVYAVAPCLLRFRSFDRLRW